MLESYQTNDYSFNNYQDLNDHLLYIDYVNKNYEYTVASVTPDMGYRYQGNFYGLLKELGVNSSLFLFTGYLNGILNPTDYNGTLLTFKIATRPPIPIG